MDFPYQLTTFLTHKPQIGEPVYNGQNGWYPQLALKRRFKLEGIDEDELFGKLKEYCSSYSTFTIHTGSLTKPERMPVQIIEVEQSQELMNFHLGFIAMMGDSLQSRYPERDGSNYLPHITAEYDNKMVIDKDAFTNKEFLIEKIWLLKDVADQDSEAYKVFDLYHN